MKTLISNTSFGELCKSKENEFSRRIDYLDWFERVRNNFDNFLKQLLKLEMFFPCDEDGNVLEKPENYIEGYDDAYNDEIYNYLRAKEKVLFKGVSINGEDENIITLEFENTYIEFHKEHGVFMCGNYVLINIEDLSNYELQLTESAIKQIEHLLYINNKTTLRRTCF